MKLDKKNASWRGTLWCSVIEEIFISFSMKKKKIRKKRIGKALHELVIVIVIEFLLREVKLDWNKKGMWRKMKQNSGILENCLM